jgi:hypothetical protein
VTCARSTPSSSARRRTSGPTNCPESLVFEFPATEATSAIGAGDCGFAARCSSTSSDTMRPPGPVPRTPERSRSAARAMRRAFGEDLIRPPSPAPPMIVVVAVVCFSASGFTSSAGAADAAAPLGAGSPSPSSHPITAPTGSTSPAAAPVARMPSASASTSTSTLSVSSRSNKSPIPMCWPSLASHSPMTPSCIVSPNFGSTIC